MSKNELLEMISNLEVQLNEAEDKITMSTHLQVSNNCKLKCVLTLRILKLKIFVPKFLASMTIFTTQIAYDNEFAILWHKNGTLTIFFRQRIKI